MYELIFNLLFLSIVGCMSVVGFEILYIDSSGWEIDIVFYYFVDVCGCYCCFVLNCFGCYFFYDCLFCNWNFL